MEIHPITNCYPMMDVKEMKELISDIKMNGLLYPVTIQGDVLLDGRNRIEACRQANVDVRFDEYKGDDPVGFIISTNKRRNLDASQRAMVAARIANLGKGRPEKNASKEAFLSQPDAAKVMNVSRASVQRAKAVLDADPDLAEQVAQGKVKVAKAEKVVREKQKTKRKKEAVEKISEEAKIKLSDVCDIQNCSMVDLLSSGIKPDCIITDPPYPKKYLPLYEDLARLSKDIPLVAVMCGQSYLPEIMLAMCRHLTYRWTIAYLTPGGQAVQQFPRKINTFWKPVLLFGESLDWIGDVIKSATNDNDKRFHDWGQSESGMVDLVERISKPGQLICDPFGGAFTTAVAALRLGRHFVGCDIDIECVKKGIERSRLIYV